MKKFGTITGSSIVFLIVLFCVCTESIDNTPYFETGYFKQTCARIDSLKSTVKIKNGLLQAGFAKFSIAPSLNHSEDNSSEGKFVKVPLAGYGKRKGKPAVGVRDSTFVKAVALKIDQQTIVLVGADLLILPPNITDSVTTYLSAKGIRRGQLFFSATHTHSGPGAWGHGFAGEQFAGDENKNFQKWLISQISKAVISAIADLKPATIGSGNFNAGTYTRNRLIGELGTKNDDFSYLVIEQTGYKKAVIGSFSAHPTTLGSSNMEISADYPGYWQRKIETTSADLAVFFAGSVGSQGPVVENKDFHKTQMIGEALADSLNRHLLKTNLTNEITFSSISLKIQLPRYNIRLTSKINLSTLLTNKLMPFPENVYLQAFRIGKMIWITTPADFSGEYALQIKNSLAVKGFSANVSSFNGNYIGYIIPGRYFYLDKYESKTMGLFGPNMGDYTMDLIRQITEIVIKEPDLNG